MANTDFPMDVSQAVRALMGTVPPESDVSSSSSQQLSRQEHTDFTLAKIRYAASELQHAAAPQTSRFDPGAEAQLISQ